jgi:hypothetical protein
MEELPKEFEKQPCRFAHWRWSASSLDWRLDTFYEDQRQGSLLLSKQPLRRPCPHLG